MAILNLDIGSFFTSLTTNPDIMLAKAAAVQSRIREMQKAFNQLERTVNKTGYYWIGEAGDAHRDYYNVHKDDVDRIFKRLTEDVDDLKEMARVYAGTEAAVKEISEELPSDVIE